MPKHSSVKREPTKAEKIISGVIAGAFAACVLLLVYSLLVANETVGMQYTKYAVCAINLISGAVCGAVAIGRGGGRKKIYGIFAGAVFAAAIIVLASIANDAVIEIGKIGRITACTLAGTILGVLVPLGKSNKKLRKSRSKKK